MKNGHSKEQETVIAGRKGQKNEALDLADFEVDDILSTPGERLLAEAGEDFGDPTLLAAEFDAIALPLLSGADGAAAARVAAASASGVAQAAAGVASWRASPAASPSVPSSFRHSIRATAERLATPLRSRAVWGAFATLLLLAVLAPAVYPLLVERVPVERPALPSQNDLRARPAAMLQPAPPLSQPMTPAPGAAQSSLAAPASPPSAVLSAAKPSSATPENSLGEAEAIAARGPQLSAPWAQAPQRIFAPRQVATAAAKPAAPTPPAVGQEEARALPPPLQDGGFVVELSMWSSEALAQSSFRALKSKYAVLRGHEPLIKRTDDGSGGMSYALQFGPFESPEEAERLCASLRDSGKACSVRGH
jgi:hypothetical protein